MMDQSELDALKSLSRNLSKVIDEQHKEIDALKVDAEPVFYVSKSDLMLITARDDIGAGIAAFKRKCGVNTIPVYLKRSALKQAEKDALAENHIVYSITGNDP